MGIETMMIGSMIAGAGSSLMSGIGQQNQLSAQASSARYQAQVAENNRQIAEQNARYATMAGAGNAQAQDFQTRAQLGQARVAQAAGGLDVASGSPVEVRSSIAQLGRLKALERSEGRNTGLWIPHARHRIRGAGGLQRAGGFRRSGQRPGNPGRSSDGIERRRQVGNVQEPYGSGSGFGGGGGLFG
jgi:hypothetical protein